MNGNIEIFVNWADEITDGDLISVFDLDASRNPASNRSWKQAARSSGGPASGSPWGLVLPPSAEFRVNHEGERLRILQALRDAHLFLLENTDDINYYAGWLIQAGRIPRRSEFFDNFSDAKAALSAMTETAPENRDPSEIAFTLPRGFVSSRPSQFFLPVRSRKSLVIGATLESQYRIPEPFCSTVKIWLKSISAASTVQVTVNHRFHKFLSTIELGNWEEGWREVSVSGGGLKGGFNRAPGEIFRLAVEVVAGTVELGVSDRSNPALIANDSSEPIAIRFIPGRETTFERFRFRARRAISLLRRGDFKRFWFALKRRLPRF